MGLDEHSGHTDGNSCPCQNRRKLALPTARRTLPAGLLRAAPCSPVGGTFRGCADYVECSDITNATSCRAFDANGFALEGGVGRVGARRVPAAPGADAADLTLQYAGTAAGRLEITVFESGGEQIGPLAALAK